MDAQFWVGLVIGALVSSLLWFFKPDWLRQRVGIDPKPPYQLPGIDANVLRNDLVIGSTLPPADQLSWFLATQAPLKLQQGYAYYLTPDGRRCVHLRHDYRGAETLVLLAKPKSPK